ncbi:MAG: hypothetical protein Q9209_001680 [Squamulea sp. 1 TL-2023]
MADGLHQSGRSVEEAITGVDLNRNIEALIENPLSHLTPQQLEKDVRAFARLKGLDENLELLQRGAQIAKDPQFYESIPGVTGTEIKALRDERYRRFRQPRALYLTIVICSIGAAVQGWDQTGSNGANLYWPKAFGLKTDRKSNDFWILGLVNAAPYIAASLIGCWLSHPLNYYLGRRGVVFVAAWFCFFSVLGSACAQTWVQLFICRLLLGIGMGTKASTIPVLAAESSPASIRGSLVMGWQLWVAFGIFLGFSANLILFQIGDIAWRLQLGSAFIPAVPLIIGIYFCPESPRWYIKKHRYHDAFKSLQRLRNTPLQAARDLYYIHAQVRLEELMLGDGDITSNEGEEQYSSSGRYANRFTQLFTIARIRRATLAASVVMIAQQMCGINIMAFYSSTLFTDANASERSALLVSWGFGLVNFVFAWPAVRSIDRFGRRNLLLFTFPHMAWTLLGAGFCFYIPNDSPAHLGMITLFVYLFAAFYSPGEGPVPFTYSAEAFPLFHREVGMSLAVSINLFWAAVLTVVYPKLSDALTPTGAIGFFAGLNIIALLMIFLWVPETKQRTLEELDYIFAVPTRKHMHYQVAKVLPYSIKRYILRRDVELEPLYKFPIEPDVETFRLEVQTLDKFLNLIERIRSAEADRLPVEEAHLQDLNRLLLRCHRILYKLLVLIRHVNSEADEEIEPWDLKEPTFSLPRVYISFFTRTLQMALMTFTLAEESMLMTTAHDDTESALASFPLPPNGTHSTSRPHEIDLSIWKRVPRSLRTRGSNQAVQIPIEPLHPPFRRGSSVGSPQLESRTDEQASDDSNCESIADSEPDVDVAFTLEAYDSIITHLYRELERNMNTQDYYQAEKTYKTMEKRYVDRETNLKIPFDNRPELRERLAEIYLNQKRYRKAKRVLISLLRETALDADRKWRLYLLLANAYFGLGQLTKAESLARASLKGRHDLYGKDHPLTQQSAILVISTYEAQDDVETAMPLRGYYCPHTIPPPPPKSALRSASTSQRPREASGSSQSPNISSVPKQQFPHENEESQHQSSNRVRWAANVWATDYGINAHTQSGKTKLIEAIYSGDEQYVQLILGRNPSVEALCVDLISPLMHAVMCAHKGIIEALLNHGAQVDGTTSGWTALHKATDAGQRSIMQLLLAHGANIEAKAPSEYHPPVTDRARFKAIAQDLPDPTTATIYDEKEHSWTPLLRAASKGDEPAVRLLLDRGASIHARSHTEGTPLLHACEALHPATVDLLLMRGSDIHAYDKHGWRPLHHALVKLSPDSPTLLQKLVDQGCDVDARCNYRKTPLHHAVERGNSPAVAFLLNHDADVEARDAAERTPLHTAIECRSESMVRLLLDSGADAAAMDKEGHDALAAANHAVRKSPEIIALLRNHKQRMKKDINKKLANGKEGASRKGSLGGDLKGGGAGNAIGAAGLPSKKDKSSWLLGTGKGK